jgi:hypothetical protein
MKMILFLTLSFVLFGCANRPDSSTTISTDHSTESVDTPNYNLDPPADPESPFKFGLASEIIPKINSQMGLGTLLTWQNDADPGDPPSWFTALEYDVNDPNKNRSNANNVIELSIGSKDQSGQYVEFFEITAVFMNPDDKGRAKKLYLEKIDLISTLFHIPIPTEVRDALKSESNLKTSSNDYTYEVEEYGAARRSLSLKIR